MRNPLHQTTIAHKHVGKVVDDLMVWLIKLRRQRALGDSQPHRVRQPLPQRPGGGFNPRGIADFRVARRFGMQLTEVFYLFDGQIIARQMQQAVEQHRRVAVGENKAVAIVPLRVFRIVLKEIVPQHLCDIGHAHRRAGVAGVGFLDCIHTQGADGVSEFSTGHNVLLKQ